jgi:hemerythrin-like domain-containing protein
MPNAIEMLKEDHRKVKELFEEFEHAQQDQVKEHIVENTVHELEIHATLEEEIFYPAAEEEIGEKESIDEAREEHHVVKLLIGELKKMSADDERYDAKYTVLAENVKHHIEEEESELFPKLEGKLDAEELGAQMETRKKQLQQRPQKRSAKAKGRTRTRKARQRRSTQRRKRASGGHR